MRLLLGATLGLGVACGPSAVPSVHDVGSSGSGGTTADPPAETTSSTGDAPPADEGSGGFIDDRDLGDEWCDPFTQNCPSGLKCTMVSEDGGVYNGARCVPVVEDPSGLGEPCTEEGPPDSGFDTCDLGAICWDVNSETGEGICRALCTGDESNMYCEDPRTFCPVTSNGSFLVCEPICDPLIQDCPTGQACTSWRSVFICALEAESPAAVGEPCDFSERCESGLDCVDHYRVADCEGAIGCCTSLCDLGESPSPCVPPEECRPFFEEPLPLYEALGVCSLPP